jgi:hypothetical protein
MVLNGIGDLGASFISASWSRSIAARRRKAEAAARRARIEAAARAAAEKRLAEIRAAEAARLAQRQAEEARRAQRQAAQPPHIRGARPVHVQKPRPAPHSRALAVFAARRNWAPGRSRGVEGLYSEVLRGGVPDAPGPEVNIPGSAADGAGGLGLGTLALLAVGVYVVTRKR